MDENLFVLNTVYSCNLEINDLKERAFNIENTDISLVFKNIQSSNVVTTSNGALLNFINNHDLNISNICCSNFFSPVYGLFFYISTPNTINALFLSLDSSTSQNTNYGLYVTSSDIKNINCSNTVTYQGPAIILYGSESKSSSVSFYSVSMCHASYKFITEATYGVQTWKKINILNSSSIDAVFKVYLSTTTLTDAVFAGNWGSLLMVNRESGALSVSNVVIQSNGTFIGISTSSFTLSDEPKAIEMTLPNQWYCQTIIRRQKECKHTLFRASKVCLAMILLNSIIE